MVIHSKGKIPHIIHSHFHSYVKEPEEEEEEPVATNMILCV